jgi:hypothetical protein
MAQSLRGHHIMSQAISPIPASDLETTVGGGVQPVEGDVPDDKVTQGTGGECVAMPSPKHGTAVDLLNYLLNDCAPFAGIR